MLVVVDLTQGTTRLKSLMAIKCMSFSLRVIRGKLRGGRRRMEQLPSLIPVHL